MIISVYLVKSIDKVQNKISRTSSKWINTLQYIKAMHNKSIANIMLNGAGDHNLIV